ncbi:MAG: Gfo/Idh/MocA family oxidoreductase [Kiritimatiellaeota bacterium]|nr:Gfo/Idh/MocA family oxidoreductase [Kiritimatiellota bacterium]
MTSESECSRRDFFAAATAAGLVLGTAARAETAPAPTPPSNRIRYVLFGHGLQGRTLLDAMRKIPGIEIAAVCDIWKLARDLARSALLEAQIKIPVYENFEDLLAKEKDIQAAIVATPDFWHAPVTNACLKAGLHVYCEKMMSNTLEGARSMVCTMRETGKLLQIGHQRRSNPRYLFALNYLLNRLHLCGRITSASGQWNRSVAQSQDFGVGKSKGAQVSAELLAKYGYENMHQFRNWRWFKKYGGGPLSDLGAHQIDVFNWFLGALPRAVTAVGGMDFYPGREWYDNATAIYEYALPSGVVRARYEVQTTTSAGGYFETFLGDLGSLRISEDATATQALREFEAPSWDEHLRQNYLQLLRVEVKETDPRKVAAPPKKIESYGLPGTFNKPLHQPHLENFFDAIRGKAKLNCPADEAFRSESIIHKANEAIAALRTLEITAADTEV